MKSSAALKAAKPKPVPAPVEIHKPERAPASVWTGSLSFGLVTLPVKLHTGARADRIEFHTMHRSCQSRIKKPNYCPTCDIQLGAQDTQKCYEFAPGQYVTVEADELKQLEPESAKVIEIERFTKAAEIDAVYYEASFFVAPQDGGHRAYHLLRLAMQKHGLVGIAKVVMHSREHLVAVRPYGDGLALHTLYYAEEIRAIEFPAMKEPPRDAELKVCGDLIKALASPFEPDKYSDGYAAAVRALLDARVRGEAPVIAARKPSTAAPADVMAAMEATLAKLKSA